MIYEYRCKMCNHIEDVYATLADRPPSIVCPKCNMTATRIISYSQGIQRDEPTWLDSAKKTACTEGAEKRIATRTEFNKYLKEKGIAHVG